MNILVLGIGNLLMADDGIGVRVIQLLTDRYRFPGEVNLVEGGTLGLDLLPQVQDAQRLLIVDAVETGAAPGTLVRYAGDAIPSTPESKLSPHQVGLKDLLTLAAALGGAPEEIVLWGVQPESVTVSMELSAAVEAQLEPLVAKLLEELACWGISPLPTSSSDLDSTTGTRSLSANPR
ncbi:HyaD/HybD family hydrogenase maturation endopeptidase [Geomonas sp.]|uniref:HyaD/HybD family hydrogenase maturation endopeptidase n=1 Tax=Geomonas sp. TaxID=2651584 RepID=UPI002B4762C6|nr:HyaD/HybD family hydrogenase maturation endopeptidase [Geomonas sp.]HJV33531.1 HyaD/HybD family hydrogenase maturation endopeptidase [Geomonas sp.]